MCLDWTTVKLFEIISKLWRNSPTKHAMWIGENWLSWNGLYSLDWVLNNVTKLNIKERLWGWALVRCRSKLVFRWLQRNCIWNTKKKTLKVVVFICTFMFLLKVSFPCNIHAGTYKSHRCWIVFFPITKTPYYLSGCQWLFMWHEYFDTSPASSEFYSL